MSYKVPKVPRSHKQKAKPVMPAAVSKILAEAPGGGLDSRELLNELVRVWGGASEMAQDIRDEFRQATPGGMTRQRILEMLQRLIINNTSHNLTSVRRPEDMPQDELLETARGYFNRLMNHEEAHPADPEEDDACEPTDD